MHEPLVRSEVLLIQCILLLSYCAVLGPPDLFCASTGQVSCRTQDGTPSKVVGGFTSAGDAAPAAWGLCGAEAMALLISSIPPATCRDALHDTCPPAKCSHVQRTAYITPF